MMEARSVDALANSPQGARGALLLDVKSPYAAKATVKVAGTNAVLYAANRVLALFHDAGYAQKHLLRRQAWVSGAVNGDDPHTQTYTTQTLRRDHAGRLHLQIFRSLRKQ